MSYYLTPEEAQIFDDNMRGYRDSESLARFREIWPHRAPRKDPVQAAALIFANTVVALTERGMDLETARYAAGQATTRLPDGDIHELVKFALHTEQLRAA